MRARKKTGIQGFVMNKEEVIMSTKLMNEKSKNTLFHAFLKKHEGMVMIMKTVHMSFIVLAMVALGFASAQATEAQQRSCSPPPQKAEKKLTPFGYEDTRLSFIQNKGQVDARYAYYNTGQAYGMYFSPEAVLIRLSNADGAEVVTMKRIAGHPTPKLIAEDELLGKINYLIGNDPGKWHKQIPTFGAIRYENAFEGVDIRYYGNQTVLEYDIIVNPGESPEKVKFAFDGIENLSVDDSGALIISLKQGKLLQHKPVVYQEIDGRRFDIAGNFSVKGSSFGFDVGEYDSRYPLVIDPVLEFATYIGGSGDDIAFSMDVDPAGDIVIAGITNSSNYPVTDVSLLAGDYDGFISKFNRYGRLLWSTYYGGSARDILATVKIGRKSGSVVFGGFTDSSNLPLGGPAFNTTANGGINGFLAKMDINGDLLFTAYYVGSTTATDNIFSLSLDFETENIYILATKDNVPRFAKVLADGSAVAYEEAGAGINNLTLNSLNQTAANRPIGDIFIDKNKNIYIAARQTENQTMAICSGFQCRSGGASNFSTVVYKFKEDDATNTRIPLWGTRLGAVIIGGCSAFTEPTSILADNAGIVYVGGTFFYNCVAGFSDVSLNAGFDLSDNAYQRSFSSNTTQIPDAYLLIADTNATGAGSLVYSTLLGTPTGGQEYGIGVAFDALGFAYLNISSNGTLPTPTGQPSLTTFGTGGNFDIYVYKFDPYEPTAANTLVDGFRIGGDAFEHRYYHSGFGIDGRGDLYVTGGTWSTNFPTLDAYQPTCAGCGSIADAFLAKISGLSTLLNTDSDGDSLTNSCDIIP